MHKKQLYVTCPVVNFWTTPKLKFCNKIEVSEQRTLFLLLFLRFLPLMFWRNPVGTKENGTFDKWCYHQLAQGIPHILLAVVEMVLRLKVGLSVWVLWPLWVLWLPHSDLCLGSIEFEKVNIDLLGHNGFSGGTQNSKLQGHILDTHYP